MMEQGMKMKKNINIIDAIRQHPLFREYYKRLEEAERDRKFCCHQMDHLLDVARIAYIQNLEQELGFSKNVIYAAALLHDIGKVRQYEEGIPHEIASAEIAEVILREVSLPGKKNEMEEPGGEGFSEEERTEILRAVRGHRKYYRGMSGLEKLLYTSDKKSRQCFACFAESECNWSLEKKNMEIEI